MDSEGNTDSEIESDIESNLDSEDSDFRTDTSALPHCDAVVEVKNYHITSSEQERHIRS